MSKKQPKKKTVMTDEQYVAVSGQLCPVCRTGAGLEGNSVEVEGG